MALFFVRGNSFFNHCLSDVDQITPLPTAKTKDISDFVKC